MINVLICDDSGKQIILTKNAILDYQTNKRQALFRIRTAFTTKDALQYISANQIDIAVLDIEIDDKTGIDIAKEILTKNPDCKIIFVTNYDSFAYSAYEIEAFSYMLKPFASQKLFLQLDRILIERQKEQLLKRYQKLRLEIRYKGTTTWLYQDDILYIEKKGKNVVVVTESAHYEYTDNLKDLEEKLDSRNFIRCHNGFIVNLNRITYFRRTEVFVGKQEISIPISKANISKVANILEKKIWENVL